jgi:hypothetical protein
MFTILENGQVMKLDKSVSYEQWLPVGNEYTYEEIKDAEGTVTETITRRFNLELGEYEII